MANIFPFFDARRQVSKRLALSDMSDCEVMQTTRFPRDVVEELRNMIGGELDRHTRRSHLVPVETQLMAALQFYATGSFQWVVGRNCGLAQSSVNQLLTICEGVLGQLDMAINSRKVSAYALVRDTTSHVLRCIHPQAN